MIENQYVKSVAEKFGFSFQDMSDILDILHQHDVTIEDVAELEA
jgi:hypothetical protein